MGSSELGVRILWTITGGFLVGVLMRSLVPISSSFGLFVLVLAIAWSVALLGRRDASRLRIFVPVWLVACVLGAVRMDTSILRGAPGLDKNIGSVIEFDGVVFDEPDARDTSVRVPVRSVATSSESQTAVVLVILPARTDIFYGEKVKVRGTLVLPRSFDDGAGRQFNYPGYLVAQGIGYELDRAELIQPGEFAGNPIVAGAYLIKEAIISGLERALPEPHAGLAGGITVGEKRALGKDVTQEFRTVSLVHIIVLSGYNISVVITYLFALLSRLRAPRYLRFGSGAVVALFFAVMTGFAPASLRAALMALIAISGQMSNRIYRPERALALVALCMVAWNPYVLVFDPGFQLSFLATLGLMLFSPLFEHVYNRAPRSFLLRETLVATSSAQLSVLPLLLYESGNLSLVGIFANIVVLPVIPLAMACSAIAAIFGVITPVIAPILGLPAQLLLAYVLAVVHIFSQVPFASVTVPAFSAWWLLPIYAILFAYGFATATKNAALKSRAALET